MRVIIYILQNIFIGVLCFILFLNNILDVWLKMVRNESIGLMLVIGLLSVIPNLLISAFCSYSKKKLLSTIIIKAIGGVIISYISFACCVIITFMCFMNGM